MLLLHGRCRLGGSGVRQTTAMPTLRIEIIGRIMGQLSGRETLLIVAGRPSWLTAPLQ